jgi:uncharacterized protein YjbI with pentapeptide repeats
LPSYCHANLTNANLGYADLTDAILVPSVMAAKQSASGVHVQGTPPDIQFQGTTSASSTSFVLAGLGQGSGTAELTVKGSFAVTCANPGQNTDVPGQRTTATGTSQPATFSSDKNGKATVNALTATLDPPNSADLSKSCPNSQWTPSIVPGSGTVTSATLTVTFNGAIIYTDTKTV